MKKWSKVIALTVMVMLVVSFALAGCGTPKKEESKAPAPQPKPQVLKMNWAEEPPALDPQITTDQVSFEVLNNVMEGLVRIREGGKIEAGIAEKWDISPDGLKYTFHLRDAKWSDGSPVTANDFDFAWRRAINPKTASEYAYQLYYIKGAEKANSINIKDADADKKIEDAMKNVGIKVVDPKTLEVTLETPTPYFLGLTAFGTYMPTKKEFFDKMGDKFASEADKMLYNGPFVIKEWVHESKLNLAKNPNYWNAKAVKLDEIQGAMVKDTNAAVNMYEAGELDIMGVTGDFIPNYKDKGMKTMPEATTWWVEYNLKDPFFKNLNIRKAFSLAIDRQAFVDNVLKNGSVVATGFVPPLLNGLNDKFRKESGDYIPKTAQVDEAKKLLAAGMKELGLTTAPKLKFLAGDSAPAKKYSQGLQEFWKKNLGIEVELVNVNFKTRLQMMTKNDFSFVFAGWGADYDDPMTFMDLYVTGGTNQHSSFSNKEYDKLIEEAKKTNDQKVRMENMKKAEKILMEQLPIAPLYHPAWNYVEKPYVKGVERFPLGADLLFLGASVEGKK